MEIKKLDIQDAFIAGDVWRLQHAAYAIEAQIIGYTNLPPLMDTITSLQASKETFYSMQEDGDLLAVIAVEAQSRELTISRVMVHPTHHRRGLGRRLLRFIEATYPHVEKVLVATGSLNLPALRLYDSEGYVPQRQWQAAPGLMLTELIKLISRDHSVPGGSEGSVDPDKPAVID
jgi:GNAT superfamily N-acetyltransferase